VIDRPVAGLVLAGGASRRFGGGKLLHKMNGRTLIECALQAPLHAPLSQVVVVTGAYHAELAPVLAPYPVQVVYNPDWEGGLSTSLKAGLARLMEAAAVVICLADQPDLPAAVITALVETYRRTGARIVAPALAGVRRNPVLFDRSLFPDLLATQGDEGGRSVIRRHEAELALVPFDQAAWFRDIDVPADL